MIHDYCIRFLIAPPPLVILDPVKSGPCHGPENQHATLLRTADFVGDGPGGGPVLDAERGRWCLVRQFNQNSGSVRQNPMGYAYQHIFLRIAAVEPDVHILRTDGGGR